MDVTIVVACHVGRKIVNRSGQLEQAIPESDVLFLLVLCFHDNGHPCSFRQRDTIINHDHTVLNGSMQLHDRIFTHSNLEGEELCYFNLEGGREAVMRLPRSEV